MSLMIRPPLASAHNHQVHYDMTELGYEVMLLAVRPTITSSTGFVAGKRNTPHLLQPNGATAQEWAQFLSDLNAAVPRLRVLPSHLPVRPLVCGLNNNGVTMTNGWAQGTLGLVTSPVAPDYITSSSDCGTTPWTPGGIFNDNPHDFTGTVLALYAAGIDDQIDDTHLEIRPTNVLGLGAAKKGISDAWKKGAAVVLAPFVCLADLFLGLFSHHKSCLEEAKDLAKETDPVDKIDSFIPGIGDITSDQFTGVWHFLNLWDGAPNEFDDRQGLETDIAFNGTPDTVEVVLMAITDAAGLSVKPDKSDGVQNYQISGSDDGSADSQPRDKGDWNAISFAHVVFSPVDNLAYYGWRRFRDQSADRPTEFLGNTLHALGDATVPMHVAATSGWGHRPYEDAVSRVWDQLRYTQGSDAEQWSMANVILSKAFRWRKTILAWRAAHPGHDHEVPVRMLVNALGRETFDSSASKSTSDLWPFNPVMSSAYLIDKNYAISYYETFPSATPYYRQTLLNGIGAEIAFLMSATEVEPWPTH